MKTDFYSTKKWIRKRNAILRRDKYICQECKRYGKTVPAKVVHHKKELENFPELAFDNNNLISLCMSCHNKVHTEKGGNWR